MHPSAATNTVNRLASPRIRSPARIVSHRRSTFGDKTGPKLDFSVALPWWTKHTQIERERSERQHQSNPDLSGVGDEAHWNASNRPVEQARHRHRCVFEMHAVSMMCAGLVCGLWQAAEPIWVSAAGRPQPSPCPPPLFLESSLMGCTDMPYLLRGCATACRTSQSARSRM